MEFILVHGAFLGAACWAEVSAYMSASGHTVFTPTLTGVAELKKVLDPSIDLDTHIGDIAKLIAAEGLGDAIVVGHSYAGMVITGVAERCRHQIRQLVYLDAVIPEDGESFLQVCHPEVAHQLKLAVKDGYVQLPDDWSAASFGVDKPEEQRRVEAQMTPQPFRCFEQPLHAPTNAAEALPRAFICCTDSRTAPFFAAAASKAQREKMVFREIASAHVPMITHPAELARILIELGESRDSVPPAARILPNPGP